MTAAIWSKAVAVARPLEFRWLCLWAILPLEVLGMALRFEAPPMADNAGWESPWLLVHSRELWRMGLGFAILFGLAAAPRLSAVLGDLRRTSSNHGRLPWLAGHGLALAGFAALTAFLFETPEHPALSSPAGLAAWLVLAGLTLLLWLLAIAPGRAWLRLAGRERRAMLAGLLLGLPAGLLCLGGGVHSLAQRELWKLLATPTLHLVHGLLGLAYSDLVYQPEDFVIGPPAFQAQIFAPCAGYEGMTLIAVLLAVHVWLFRRGLRFPNAFWLLPLGILAMYSANVVRIALLIAIGASFSPQVAMDGFHSQAGWIALAGVALGVIALSHRLPCFAAGVSRVPADAERGRRAAALLVPFMSLMAASMVTAALSSGFDRWYPVPMAVAGLVLWRYRRAYGAVAGTPLAWPPAAIGVLVFLPWLGLEPVGGTTNFPDGLAELPPWTASAWLGFRVLGSVLVVPWVEELAFRGYLLRKLIAPAYERVQPGHFTWLSFLGSSILFGLLHERWLAGTLAGMAYALALYRRGRLGDAILAHIVTNALIAVWVLALGRWELWR